MEMTPSFQSLSTRWSHSKIYFSFQWYLEWREHCRSWLTEVLWKNLRTAAGVIGTQALVRILFSTCRQAPWPCIQLLRLATCALERTVRLRSLGSSVQFRLTEGYAIWCQMRTGSRFRNDNLEELLVINDAQLSRTPWDSTEPKRTKF